MSNKWYLFYSTDSIKVVSRDQHGVLHHMTPLLSSHRDSLTQSFAVKKNIPSVNFNKEYYAKGRYKYIVLLIIYNAS